MEQHALATFLLVVAPGLIGAICVAVTSRLVQKALRHASEAITMAREAIEQRDEARSELARLRAVVAERTEQ